MRTCREQSKLCDRENSPSTNAIPLKWRQLLACVAAGTRFERFLQPFMVWYCMNALAQQPAGYLGPPHAKSRKLPRNFDCYRHRCHFGGPDAWPGWRAADGHRQCGRSGGQRFKIATSGDYEDGAGVSMREEPEAQGKKEDRRAIDVRSTGAQLCFWGGASLVPAFRSISRTLAGAGESVTVRVISLPSCSMATVYVPAAEITEDVSAAGAGLHFQSPFLQAHGDAGERDGLQRTLVIDQNAAGDGAQGLHRELRGGGFAGLHGDRLRAQAPATRIRADRNPGAWPRNSRRAQGR